jgi:hypothetical protein
MLLALSCLWVLNSLAASQHPARTFEMQLLTDCEAWMPLVDELVQDDELQVLFVNGEDL